MLSIESIEQAQVIWDRFDEKYQTQKKINHLIPRLQVEDDFSAPQFTHSARKIQQFWQRLRQQDTLLEVNLKGYHSPEFKFFVHGEKVKKCINRQKLADLHLALEQGNWSATIYQDPLLPQLALALYASHQISYQQIVSILEYCQTRKIYPKIEILPLLDANLEFTKDAEFIFTTIVRFQLLGNTLEPLTKKHLQELRLMLACLPASERVIYSTLANLHGFTNRLNLLDTFVVIGNHILHFSAGVRDALSLVRFGYEGYPRVMPRLGMLKIDEIEEGVRRSARYAAIDYPDTKAYRDELHGWMNINDFEATQHDVYHTNLMSTIPLQFRQALLRLIHLAREKTKTKWSLEIWDWADAEFNYFFHILGRAPNIYNVQNASPLFEEFLNYGSGSRGIPNKFGGGLLRQGQLTCLGILSLLDMIQNRVDWLSLKIDPNYFKNDFLPLYRQIKILYPQYLKDQTPEWQVLVTQIYFILAEKKKLYCLPSIMSILLQNQQSILSQLKFGKIKKGEHVSLANSLVLHWQDQPLNFSRLPDLLRLAHSSNYFVEAIMDFGLSLDRASYYIQLREEGMSKQKARFTAQPCFRAWLGLHWGKILISALMIFPLPLVLLYGICQIQTQVAALDDKRIPTLA
jgi:hypothetical protein